jgi:hypothetical protein
LLSVFNYCIFAVITISIFFLQFNAMFMKQRFYPALVLWLGFASVSDAQKGTSSYPFSEPQLTNLVGVSKLKATLILRQRITYSFNAIPPANVGWRSNVIWNTSNPTSNGSGGTYNIEKSSTYSKCNK